MQAIVSTQYGTPDHLRFDQVDTPTPGENEVRVKIHATSINFGDIALATGKPFLIRLMGYGLFSPKYPVFGTDIAGRVDAVGTNATRFKVGDRIFADVSEVGFGAFAEYVAVPEEVLVPIPDNISFEQAGAVPQAAVVALQGLRDKGGIKAGQHVLINGASGGIGPFAVQIAKAFATEVTGVCSARNAELVRSIGADHVIDYTREDFTRNKSRYDLILDIVANRSVGDYVSALKQGGAYVAVAFNATSLFLGPLLSTLKGKTVVSLAHKPKTHDLAFMAQLLADGKVTPVIDRCYPLSQVPEAMHYVSEGNPRGKVVITVTQA